MNLEIGGNTAKAAVELVGGAGLDITLDFEQVIGLTASNLGLSAAVVSPSDPLLLARLPTTATIPAGLPVIFSIEPPAAGGLTFSGVVTLAVHTHDLVFTAGCPLRLFAAEAGGDFHDITDGMGIGSYRARGTRGSFSEFLIGVDLRQLSVVSSEKLGDLRSTLSAYEQQIPLDVYDDLDIKLGEVESSYSTSDLAGAIAALNEFESMLVKHAGCDIPNVWRAARDLDNVAGELIAGARTARFNLSLELSWGP